VFPTDSNQNQPEQDDVEIMESMCLRVRVFLVSSWGSRWYCLWHAAGPYLKPGVYYSTGWCPPTLLCLYGQEELACHTSAIRIVSSGGDVYPGALIMRECAQSTACKKL